MEEKDDIIRKALRPQEEDKAYPCVWYEVITCPIRTKWKLSPENLTPWCTVCKAIGYLDEEKKKIPKKVQK